MQKKIDKLHGFVIRGEIQPDGSVKLKGGLTATVSDPDHEMVKDGMQVTIPLSDSDLSGIFTADARTAIKAIMTSKVKGRYKIT